MLCVSCLVSALMHVMRYSIVAQLKLWKHLTGLEYREVVAKARAYFLRPTPSFLLLTSYFLLLTGY